MCIDGTVPRVAITLGYFKFSQGDVVVVDRTGFKDSEVLKRRPHVVVSVDNSNPSVLWLVPVSTSCSNVSNKFAIPASPDDKPLSGFILCDHVDALDVLERNCEVVAKLSKETLAKVLNKLVLNLVSKEEFKQVAKNYANDSKETYPSISKPLSVLTKRDKKMSKLYEMLLPYATSFAQYLFLKYLGITYASFTKVIDDCEYVGEGLNPAERLLTRREYVLNKFPQANKTSAYMLYTLVEAELLARSLSKK